MDPIPDALEAFHDELVVWLASGDRLLVVVTPAPMRARVLEVVRIVEHHRTNVSPFVVCEAAHRHKAPGWGRRSTEARAVHEQRREAAPGSIAALPLESAPDDSPAGFAATLAALLGVSPPGASDLVVVLGPAELRDAATWTSSLQHLLSASGLGAARWVVIDVDTEPSVSLLAKTPGRVHRIELAADAPAALLSRLAEADDAPPGARSAEAPPPHPSRAPPPEPSGALLLRRQIRQNVLEAVAAAHRGDGTAAVVQQARAVAVSHEAGMTAEAVTLQTMLGTLLLANGAPARAIEAFDTAVAQASEAGRFDQAATARLAMACARQTQGDRHRALVDHAEATVAAERGDQPLLAIETARSTGQLAAELGMETQAVAFFGKAVTCAERHPALAALGSGPVAARSLAALSRRRGLKERAEQLEARAKVLEEAPVVAVEPEVVSTVTTEPEPSEPAAPAPVLAEEPAEPEGTEFLPIEVLASLHGWSADDVDRLKRITQDVLDEEVTSMLTSAELDALRGDGPLLLSPTPVLPPPELPDPLPDTPPPGAMVTPPAPEPPPLLPPADLPEAGDALSAALAKMQALRDTVIEDEVSLETRVHDRAALDRLGTATEDEDPDPDEP